MPWEGVPTEKRVWWVSKYDDLRGHLLGHTGQIRIVCLAEYASKKRRSLDTVGKGGISVPASRPILRKSQSPILAGGRIDTRPSPDRQLRRADTCGIGLKTIYPVTLISRVGRLTPSRNLWQTSMDFRIYVNSSNLFFRGRSARTGSMAILKRRKTLPSQLVTTDS